MKTLTTRVNSKRDLILKVIGDNPGIDIKGVGDELKQTYGTKIAYHGVLEYLREMINNGLIEKGRDPNGEGHKRRNVYYAIIGGKK